jgi:hypothetical protein
VVLGEEDRAADVQQPRRALLGARPRFEDDPERVGRDGLPAAGEAAEDPVALRGTVQDGPDGDRLPEVGEAALRASMTACITSMDTTYGSREAPGEGAVVVFGVLPVVRLRVHVRDDAGRHVMHGDGEGFLTAGMGALRDDRVRLRRDRLRGGFDDGR